MMEENFAYSYDFGWLTRHEMKTRLNLRNGCMFKKGACEMGKKYVELI